MPRKTIHGEPKTGLSLTITPTTKRRLKEISAALGMSQSELIERWTKEAVEGANKQLLGKFSIASEISKLCT
ncbi:MAG: hypothetical protein WBA93_21075 [Microcoleaceae cyanobacterium]